MLTRKPAPRLNRYLFTQIGLDSSALTTLGTVIHRFTEPGTYTGTVRRGRTATGRFYLRVDPACPASQVNIDLANLKPLPNGCDENTVASYVVGPMGYVIFHVAGGPGGFSVLVGTTGKDPKLLFNSAELREGDMFTAVILRPGAYSVMNTQNQTKGEITVAYPVISRERYRPAGPVTVDCKAQGFSPAAVKLGPAQPLVFTIKTAARIKIELVKPDDGPNPQPRSKVPGWRKPKPIGADAPAAATTKRRRSASTRKKKPAS